MSGKFELFITTGAIVVVAASTAVILWSGAGLAWHYAAIAGLLVSALMIPLALRGRGGAASSGRVKNLEAKLDTLGRRLQTLEQKLVEVDEKMVHYSRSTVRAVASELDAVGAVMRDLAEAVAVHDAELFAPKPAEKLVTNGGGSPLAGTAVKQGSDTAAGRERIQVDLPDIPLPVSDLIRRAVKGVTLAAPQDSIHERAAPSPGIEAGATAFPTALEDIAAVEDAISSNSVELLLQAVVILPQRRVKLYETRTRVRTSAGRMLDHAVVTRVAADLNLSRKLDAFVLEHAIKVARHLSQRGRDVPVAFSGTARAFADSTIFQQAAAAIQADGDLAGRLLMRTPHALFRDAAGRERESLDALHSIGVRFLLDDVPDFSLDSRSLAMRGARFIRIGADVMIAAGEGRLPVEIHPADLAGFLARHGLSLVVDGVSTEAIALELQEFGAALAQGEALAPARLLRLDVLDVPAVDPPAPQAREATTLGPPTKAAGAPPNDAATKDGAAEAQPRGTPLRAFLRRTTA